MTTLLRDVITSGTAVRAMELKRKDLAGKTGTTNENVDAWFCGFNVAQVGIAWIGYDQPKIAGHQRDRQRRRAADLDLLHAARAERRARENVRAARPGVVSLRINPETGLRDDSSRYSDWFLAEFTPRMSQDALAPAALPGAAPSRDVRDQLF